MTRYSAWIPAADNERFAPGSWDAQVGKNVRMDMFGTRIGWATVVSAEVAADGSGVSLTFDAELEQPAGA